MKQAESNKQEALPPKKKEESESDKAGKFPNQAIRAALSLSE